MVYVLEETGSKTWFLAADAACLLAASCRPSTRPAPGLRQDAKWIFPSRFHFLFQLQIWCEISQKQILVSFQPGPGQIQGARGRSRWNVGLHKDYPLSSTKSGNNTINSKSIINASMVKWQFLEGLRININNVGADDQAEGSVKMHNRIDARSTLKKLLNSG